jgi:hypothetical protein
VLLPLLLEKGIPSNVKEVRGLAVGTLTAAVKAAGAPQVRALQWRCPCGTRWHERTLKRAADSC